MKKFFVLAIVALLFASCSNTPTKVAQKFSEAVAKGQVDEAKKYCTEGTGKLLDFSASMGGMKVEPNYKMTVLRDSVVENVAYVFYTENDSDRERKMTLYKIDGEWKVNMDPKK